MTTVAMMLSTIWKAMQAPAWSAALGDDEERAMQIAAALSAAMGGGPVPTPAALRSEFDRAQRDLRIQAQFAVLRRRDQSPYDVLAKRHGLSVRQVRRIVHDE